MKKSFKVLAIIVGIIAILLGGVLAAASVLSERKTQRVIDVSVVPLAYVNDAASIARGKYLYQSRACRDCHGADGTGRKVIDDPSSGLYVRAPNITAGPGGVVANYTERDWVLVIRHGVKPRGQPLLVMPSDDYSRLTDADLAALVAYTRSLPAAAGEAAVIRFPLILKALYAFGAIKDAAEKIDHRLPPPAPVPIGATAAYGAYVANMCVGCHGPGYSGGKIPGAPPDWPAAANLTSGAGSAMPLYDTADKFIAMMRTGKRPDGGSVSAVMPFESLKLMTDTDLGALHVFLKTLPPRAAGSR